MEGPTEDVVGFERPFLKLTESFWDPNFEFLAYKFVFGGKEGVFCKKGKLIF